MFFRMCILLCFRWKILQISKCNWSILSFIYLSHLFTFYLHYLCHLFKTLTDFFLLDDLSINISSILKPPTITAGFLCSSASKESACNEGGLGLIPGLGRPPGEGRGYPLQYSSLESSMDCLAHGVAKSWTQLSDFHFHYYCIIVNFFLYVC